MSAFYMSLFWGCTKAQTVRREKKHFSAVTVIWGSTRHFYTDWSEGARACQLLHACNVTPDSALLHLLKPLIDVLSQTTVPASDLCDR